MEKKYLGLSRKELDRIMTAREFQERAGISQSTFYRHVRYKIPVVQYSEKRLGVRVSDYLEWMQTHTVAPTFKAR